MKRCSKCKQEKPFNEFCKNKTKKDGLHTECKPCQREQNIEYRKKLVARSKIEIPKTNVCSHCKKKKTSSEFNKNKSNKNGLSTLCKSCARESDRNYRKNLSKRPSIDIPKTKICPNCKVEKSSSEFSKNKTNKDGLKSHCKYCESEYKKLDQTKKLTNERRRNRYENDEIYKLQSILRGFIRRSIRLAKKSADGEIKKSKKSLEYLGCTLEELKNHLEKQFYSHPNTGEEMTWENHSYEGWHVDHIKPLSTFDLTKEKEIMKANHYTNLQPLWAEENLTKGSSYESRHHSRAELLN